MTWHARHNSSSGNFFFWQDVFFFWKCQSIVLCVCLAKRLLGLIRCGVVWCGVVGRDAMWCNVMWWILIITNVCGGGGMRSLLYVAKIMFRHRNQPCFVLSCCVLFCGVVIMSARVSICPSIYLNVCVVYLSISLPMWFWRYLKPHRQFVLTLPWRALLRFALLFFALLCVAVPCSAPDICLVDWL